uniref:Uncharacterized protein n=1 Tax=Timema monikensis TaxID=170555 RepID=A0A7R9HUG4_9NEOP|nr:unnamed protein product [Timema monikensis]
MCYNIVKLSHLYEHPDDVDYVVGGSLEAHVNGALSGPSFLCVMVEQFYRTRAGDKFFYENGDHHHSFTHGGLRATPFSAGLESQVTGCGGLKSCRVVCICVELDDDTHHHTKWMVVRTRLQLGIAGQNNTTSYLLENIESMFQRISSLSGALEWYLWQYQKHSDACMKHLNSIDFSTPISMTTLLENTMIDIRYA